jgi:hypothetical protein
VRTRRNHFGGSDSATVLENRLQNALSRRSAEAR